jgi:hypothetical protein
MSFSKRESKRAGFYKNESIMIFKKLSAISEREQNR